MQDTRDSGALRDTLQFVAGSSIPAQHKSVLMDALTQALRAADHVDHCDEVQQKVTESWRTEEAQTLEAFLQGKVANSWQQADEILMRAAGALHRTPADVRKKATEIGFGEAVDYALAKVKRAELAARS